MKKIQNVKRIWLVALTAIMLMSMSCKHQKPSSKTIADSVELIKEGIQQKGVVSAEEALGLNLLSKMMTGSDIDHDLINDVHAYMDASDPSDLSKEIITVFDLVQTQGNIADVDAAALEELIALTSLDKRSE